MILYPSNPADCSRSILIAAATNELPPAKRCNGIRNIVTRSAPLTCILAALLLLYASSSSIAAEVERPYPWVKITKVVKVGEPAPGMPGQIILGTGNPQIDGQNNVLFSAILSGTPSEVMYYGRPDNVWPVARIGDPVPGVPGAVITDFFSQETLSENGKIGMGIAMAGPGVTPGVNDGGLLLALPTPGVGHPFELTLAFRMGDPLPELGPGYVIGPNPFSSTARFVGWFNELGDFRTHFWIDGPGVHDENDEVWCWGNEHELHDMLRQGDPAPNMPGVLLFGADYDMFNDQNQFVFRAALTGDVTSGVDNTAAWIWEDGELTRIARLGDQVSFMPKGITWGSNSPIRGLNNNSKIVGLNHISGIGIDDDNSHLIWGGNAYNPQAMVQEGELVPGMQPGVTYSRFGNPRVSPDDQYLITAEIRGPGTSGEDDQLDFVVVYGPIDDLQVSLTDYDPVLGEPDLSYRLWRFSGVKVMSSNGLIFGVSALTGEGVTPSNDRMFIMRDASSGQWYPIIRSGYVLFGQPIVVDTGHESFLLESGGADSNRQCLSEDGILAAGFDFPGGPLGVFLVELTPFGDSDGDGDIDLVDFAQFQLCFSGPGGGVSDSCRIFDFDTDNDVDLVDFAQFQVTFTGAH
jgi:hypothetical protein